MSDLREAIAALVQAAPPDATVTVRWLAEKLGSERADQGLGKDGVDLTVPEVAAMFKRSPAAVREWCNCERLPGAYRFRNREWRIPRSAITAMQRDEARAPREPVRAATDTGAWRAHLPPKAA